MIPGNALLSRRKALRLLSLLPTAGIALKSGALWAADAGKPDVIRFGSPAPLARSELKGGAVAGIANHKGWFDEEFAGTGIRFEFPTFKGGAPMVGQALANGQLDFAVQGDLMAVINRSVGIKTRMLAPSARYGNAYIAVPLKSDIQSVRDLKGRKVSYFKGNFIHLQTLRILAAEGIGEKDIRSVYLDPASASTALIAGDIDAIVGTAELLTLKQRGLARIIYKTNDHSPRLTGQAGFLVRDDFSQKYPAITQRVVKVFVKTARWMADPKNYDEVLGLWSNDEGLKKILKEDQEGRPFLDRTSPLMDEFFISQLKATVADAKQNNLLRGSVDIDSWVDDSYVRKALVELGLQDFWKPVNAKGAYA